MSKPRSGGPFRAPIVAAVLLGSAVALVWFRRDEPVDVATESGSPPAILVEPPGVDIAAQPGDESRAGFPPALPAVAADGGVESDAPERALLPGEVAVTPMTELVDDRRQDLPPNMGANMAANEREFAAESIDTSWARGAENEIFGKFSQISGLQLVDLSVQCRSTMCRLQMTQSSGPPGSASMPRGTPFHKVLDNVGLEPRWAVAVRDRYGTLRSIAYVWREGFAPARPAQDGESPDEN